MRSALKIKSEFGGRRTASETIVLDLPRPLSVNNLFANNPRGGRFRTEDYNVWSRSAAALLVAQRPGAMLGPVEIAATIQEGRADLDGQAKCILDALVDNGIIQDDGPKIVRKLTLAWGPVIGARIEIRQAQQGAGA